MPLIDSLIGPIASIIDKIIPDKEARAKAKLELLALEGSQELKLVEAQMAAIIAEAQSPDPWTSRARPSFLYVMYAMILFALPMGVLSAFDPRMAVNIGNGITAYLRGLRFRVLQLDGNAAQRAANVSTSSKVTGTVRSMRPKSKKKIF